jgi:hypothetical protein
MRAEVVMPTLMQRVEEWKPVVVGERDVYTLSEAARADGRLKRRRSATPE